ncbi:uncharacterized protein MYCFIDRAFT_180413 [Pseudocercospora fijiensis CIRAD86]|uniref:Uncharacterized protein n=1 Tax=Pseudocercospora fijiensis (strain CIRAD86) TaxID=383855 RepID=M2YGY4_PSEFD|nr:uncharacterized protein MYCFIDRAFT_180413 [Pseudocercospora fijiensis CIRAD86]EME77080.1 hypothetical protein MYCFIDRAFT_180413 [Pseudocercospora fijiensis CIRAD86]
MELFSRLVVKAVWGWSHDWHHDEDNDDDVLLLQQAPGRSRRLTRHERGIWRRWEGKWEEEEGRGMEEQIDKGSSGSRKQRRSQHGSHHRWRRGVRSKSELALEATGKLPDVKSTAAGGIASLAVYLTFKSYTRPLGVLRARREIDFPSLMNLIHPADRLILLIAGEMARASDYQRWPFWSLNWHCEERSVVAPGIEADMEQQHFKACESVARLLPAIEIRSEIQSLRLLARSASCYRLSIRSHQDQLTVDTWCRRKAGPAIPLKQSRSHRYCQTSHLPRQSMNDWLLHGAAVLSRVKPSPTRVRCTCAEALYARRFWVNDFRVSISCEVKIETNTFIYVVISAEHARV